MKNVYIDSCQFVGCVLSIIALIAWVPPQSSLPRGQPCMHISGHVIEIYFHQMLRWFLFPILSLPDLCYSNISLAKIGRQILPLGRQIVPLGRQILPLGRHVLPLGRHLLSLGRQILPLGYEVLGFHIF